MFGCDDDDDNDDGEDDEAKYRQSQSHEHKGTDIKFIQAVTQMALSILVCRGPAKLALQCTVESLVVGSALNQSSMASPALG